MLCVALTEKAVETLKRILPQHFKEMAWLMQPLTEAERKTLVGLLTKIQQRAAERPVAPDEPPIARAS
jgi:DNA-binding MarR family transcriptional regulator